MKKGVKLYYPECNTSQQMAEVEGKESITPMTIKMMKQMGYEIKEVYGTNVT